MPKSVAIFDFDHTLITGDSFIPYLIRATGLLPTILALIGAVVALGFEHLRGRKPELRFFVKDFLIRHLLSGKKVGALAGAAAKMHGWQTINTPIMNALRDHHGNGDIIVIASGGLDLYLPEMLRDVMYNVLICTDIGVKDGVITGEMTGGNCVRARKAERVAEWLEKNGPFEQSWAYGNYPHDVPMMMCVKHRIIVS